MITDENKDRALCEYELSVQELKQKLKEKESKLRVSNSSFASLQLEYNQLKNDYDKQEKLLSEVLANKSKLQFEFDQLKQKLAITEKALELACELRDDWGGREYSGTEYDNYYDYFMAGAKEIINESNND